MDVAALSLKIDSGSVLKAANDLDMFSGAAARASNAAGLPNGSINRIVADIQRYATLMRALSPTNDNAASSMRRLTTSQAALGDSVRKTTGDIQAQIQALRELAGLGGGGAGSPGAGGGAAGLGAAFGVLEAAANSAAAALRLIERPPGGGPNPGPSPGAGGGGGSASPYYGAASLEATGQAARLAAHEAQNLFYQLNDVSVSLASGQRPMTVFMQQGSQIAQIYAQTGLGLKGFTLAVASMLGIMNTTTAATEAATFATAQQATASIAAANAQAASNVRAAETNIAIARTQIAMATTATEAAAAEARLAVAVAALGPAQAEAAITARALAKAQEEQAAAAAAARAATTTSMTAIGLAAAALAVVLVGVVAALAALTAQANDTSGLKTFTKEMGYTKAEVAKLNAVTVTFGDTMKAVFQVGWERIADSFGITTEQLSRKWGSFTSWMVTAIRTSLAGVYAALTTAQNIIPRIIDNIKTGRKEGLFEIIGGSFKDQYREAQSFMDDVVKQAGANARARQDAMAKGFYDAPREKKGGKSDAEKLADILRRAQGEIAAEQARADAIGLSAEAAIKLEQSTKLLNQIEQAKIPITDAVRAKVEALAGAYAKLKVATDTAAAVQGVVDGLGKQNDAINDQLSLVGLYGDALTKARIEMEALARARDALPKGAERTTEQYAKVIDSTKPVVRDQINLEQATRAAQLKKDAEDAAYAMDLERQGLNLTGAAAISYAFTVDRLNDAKRAGIALSPDEIAAIKAAGDAYAAQRYAIDQQAQAIADARETTKGFFADWINGVREGGNLFRSFADSVVNSLNRIIDKLLDKTLTSFLDGIDFGSLLGKSSGSNSLTGEVPTGMGKSPWTRYAMGGAFDQAQRFANGGAFTNSIVTAPTLFRFANGAKMGEMGEAGPEAIMPLKRGPNGSLGVQMHGSGRPSVQMGDVHVHNSLAGAIGADGLAVALRQSSAEAVQEVKRQLQSLLAELDQNGVIAS